MKRCALMLVDAPEAPKPELIGQRQSGVACVEQQRARLERMHPMRDHRAADAVALVIGCDDQHPERCRVGAEFPRECGTDQRAAFVDRHDPFAGTRGKPPVLRAMAPAHSTRQRMRGTQVIVRKLAQSDAAMRDSIEHVRLLFCVRIHRIFTVTVRSVVD